MKRPFFFFFLLLISTFTISSRKIHAAYCELPSWRHQVAIGPEIYHLKRIRKGGTRQDGCLYGIRVHYDYIGRYLVYWGLEASYAIGHLYGKSGNGIHLKSRFSDFDFEARIGYTFQSKSASCAQLTPFFGYGCFVEQNNYVDPSPVGFHFRNRFNYIAFGVLSKAYIRPYLTIGLNVTGRFSLDGKVKVTHDPDYKDTTLRYENKFHCRAALPLSYFLCLCGYPGELRLVPFYEYRQYGQHYNVPFIFPETRIKIFGADFQWVVLF